MSRNYPFKEKEPNSMNFNQIKNQNKKPPKTFFMFKQDNLNHGKHISTPAISLVDRNS